MLKDIHANDMAGDLQIQISANKKLENIRHERLEAFMGYFLSTVSILSIDIQKAEIMALAEMGASEEAKTDAAQDAKGVAQYAKEAASEEKGTAPPQVYAAESVVEPYAAPAAPDSQKTILAVDDDPVHLSSLKACLEGSPYKLTCLSSGEDALRYIDKKKPDLFILDIMMPGIDGLELAKRIKTSVKEAKIIFLTGSSSKDIVLKAIKSGGVDFIVKPAAKSNVMPRISKLI
jgi:CheY-like chemotaxis protein